VDAELKRAAIGIGKALLVLLVLFIAMGACFEYTSYAAERDARELCDGTKIRDDISTVIARYEHRETMLDSHGSDYIFRYSASAFDRVVCIVTVDREGKVVAKRWENWFD
jgi:hypothetical protein